MKPKNPDIVEVKTKECSSFKKSNMGNHDCRYLSIETRASSRNKFFEPHKEYVVLLFPGGFRVRKPTLDDRKTVKSDKSRRIIVSGAEPGTYTIEEQTEDFITCKLKKHEI